MVIALARMNSEELCWKLLQCKKRTHTKKKHIHLVLAGQLLGNNRNNNTYDHEYKGTFHILDEV